MRIQVLFNETSVLVPCGDGRLTVKELVDKAIVRYKKVLNKVGVSPLAEGRRVDVSTLAGVLCQHKVSGLSCVVDAGWGVGHR